MHALGQNLLFPTLSSYSGVFDWEVLTGSQVTSAKAWNGELGGNRDERGWGWPHLSWGKKEEAPSWQP